MGVEEPAEAGERAEVPGFVPRVWVVPVRLFLGAVWIRIGITVLDPDLPVPGILLPVLGFIIGIALILGAATRAFATLGIMLLIYYWVEQSSLTWVFTYPVAIAAHLLVILASAGRSIGLDVYLSERWPRMPLW